MLHCASSAKVDRPLALDAGVLPEAGSGVGVAQIQGCVCEPSRMGPPRTWLGSVRLAPRRRVAVAVGAPHEGFLAGRHARQDTAQGARVLAGDEAVADVDAVER